jgi:hypothetical protein
MKVEITLDCLISGEDKLIISSIEGDDSKVRIEILNVSSVNDHDVVVSIEDLNLTLRKIMAK